VTEPLLEGQAPDGTLGFLHVDMDAFFAACELLRHPELREEPVVVGGTGDRGVVAAASYVARSYGIRSAMGSTQARRLCPSVVFLPGDHAYYSAVSARIMELFGQVTPLVEPLSLDEAFLDVRGALRGQDQAQAMAVELRRVVFEQEGLTCSVGVATNKFLAKLATERAKPTPSRQGPVFGSGVFVVEAGTELAFLSPMPVRDLWGVGPATEKKLSRMGIETVADLRTQPVERLRSGLGTSAGEHLHQLAHARDHRPVVANQRAKSIGHEETFRTDLREPAALHRELVRMVDAVASRLHRAKIAGKTVTLKVRFASFETVTRSVTLPEVTASAHVLREATTRLLSGVETSEGVRLLGVSVSQLGQPVARQLSLDEVGRRSVVEADAIVEAIRDRFGSHAIGPAALTDPGGGLDRKVAGQRSWGPDDS
jgi:DNA polymerase-4